jgi:ATP-dependent Clp protease ATP-binding subunit ClpC
MDSCSFTEDVRNALLNARAQAAALHHEYVGPEHILLGLLQTNSSVGHAALLNLNIDLIDLRPRALELLTPGRPDAPAAVDPPYTSRAKRVLEEGMVAARELRHHYLGTEHLLLGLLREGRNLAAQALTSAGATPERFKDEVVRLLSEHRRGPAASGAD